MIFKNGQMFYDYGEYDEAIKRFGVIVTKYPKDPNAGPAGDRILSALNKAQDYENIENWARKLKTAPSFASKDQQERLVAADRRVDPEEWRQVLRRRQVRAGRDVLPARAEGDDRRQGRRAGDDECRRGVREGEAPREGRRGLPRSRDDVRRQGARHRREGRVRRRRGLREVIYYDRAAKAYELVVEKFGKGEKAADALFNAGLLRQALGQNDKAIPHYKDYAKRFASRKDAPDVAFNIGVVYQEAGQEGPAYQAFADYARIYRSTGKRIIEAHVRAGLMSFQLGQFKRAKEDFVTAQNLYKHATGAEKTAGKTWAAEARYYEGELVFREFEKVSLDVSPKKLASALKQKAKLLNEAKTIYISVADFQDQRWGNAALYRVGQIFDGFAESLANAPVPKNLPQDQQDAYRAALDEYVVQYQGAAVDAYTTGYQIVLKNQIYDEYTAKIREALGRVAADKFPPELEARTKDALATARRTRI